MGSGFSETYHQRDVKEQDRRNREIEKDLKAEKLQDKRTRKLLLLGPGESGKSTVLKQMKIIHSEGFSDMEAERQKTLIRVNIVQSMINIARAVTTLEISCSPQTKSDMKVVLEAGKMLNETVGFLSRELAGAIKRLWADRSIQECYERRAEFQLIDSAKYYFDAIDRISEPDYKPSQDDILRCRVKTTGVIEVRFSMKGTPFRVMDVGGQRSERRKWIQCFDDVTTILFITSLSEYNQKLEEDGITNRTQESLQLFNWIANHKLFLKTPLILFLNKKDLFQEKLQTTPITVAFPEYTGSHIFEECKEYIKARYLELNHDEKERFVYAHETCATDTTQMKFVLDTTVDMILGKSLTESGLL